jgi:hypothetical protein
MGLWLLAGRSFCAALAFVKSSLGSHTARGIETARSLPSLLQARPSIETYVNSYCGISIDYSGIGSPRLCQYPNATI